MLWNEIYKFFVQYIFGGYLRSNITSGSGVHYVGLIGYDYANNTYNAMLTDITTIDFLGASVPLGNYFSFIATLITIVVILLLCCALIKKIYNICAHVIG